MLGMQEWAKQEGKKMPLWRIQIPDTVFKMFLCVFFIFDLTMMAWGERIKGFSLLNTRKQRLRVSSEWPRSTPWVMGKEANPASRAPAPGLRASHFLTCGHGFLLSQLRLPKWATHPEFPENYCIFNIAKRLNLRSSAHYKRNIFSFLSCEVLKGWLYFIHVFKLHAQHIARALSAFVHGEP